MALSRQLPNWLRGYVDLTKHSEAPAHFHFFTGVSMIAGALRRNVLIDQKYFRWYPNFYTLLVAPAGIATKTTTIDLGREILRESVPSVHFGPDSMTWPALLKALADVKDLTFPPNSSIDGADLGIPICALSFFIGELGTALDPNDKRAVDILTDLWDSKIRPDWWRSTKEKGDTRIENPFLNLLAGTTPAWIADNFPAALIGAGLTSRMLLLYAEKKREFVSYPKRLVNEPEYDSLRQKLKDDLSAIAELCGEYQLSSEAEAWGDSWYRDLWTKRPTHLASSRYDTYISRKQTHVHKLAMILAAAQSSDLLIDLATLKRAAEIISSIEHDMIRIFSSIGKNGAHADIAEVLSIFRHSPQIAKIDLWRHCMNMMDIRGFDNAVLSLKQAGYIRDVIVSSRVGYELVNKRD